MAMLDGLAGADGHRTSGVLARVRGSIRRPARARTDPLARQHEALAAVAAIEDSEATLPDGGPREMFAVDRVIGPETLVDRVSTMLPAPYRNDWDVHALTAEPIRARTAADLVVHAKYDLGATVKLRAAYADAGLVVGILPGGDFGRCGVSRTVMAHAVVSRYAPDLIPALVSAGEVPDSGRYVVERWVDGRPLMSPCRLARAVPAVVEGLQRVHRGHGSTRIPLSRWAAELERDWEALRATDLVPGALHASVTDLIEQDRTLRCSWTYGDPVSSNVIETDRGIVLIDWENAASAPAMVDGAKLHLLADGPEETLRAVLAGLGGTDRSPGGSAYSPQEELALVHATKLAAHPRRAAKLVGHPRAEIFERQGRRRVERLAEALAA